MKRSPSEDAAATRKLHARLRTELKRFPPKSVSAFARTVGINLGLSEIFDETMNERRRRTVLLALRSAASKYLRAIQATRRQPIARPFPRRVDRAHEVASSATLLELELELERFYTAGWRSEAATSAFLEQIEESLRTVKAAKGRPRADDAGLLAHVAESYYKIFGIRPSTTPGGTFSNVAVIVLENAHGKTPRDVARQVRAAIKKAMTKTTT